MVPAPARPGRFCLLVRAEELFFEGLAGDLTFHGCLLLSVKPGIWSLYPIGFYRQLGTSPFSPFPARVENSARSQQDFSNHRGFRNDQIALLAVQSGLNAKGQRRVPTNVAEGQARHDR